MSYLSQWIRLGRETTAFYSEHAFREAKERADATAIVQRRWTPKLGQSVTSLSEPWLGVGTVVGHGPTIVNGRRIAWEHEVLVRWPATPTDGDPGVSDSSDLTPVTDSAAA